LEFDTLIATVIVIVVTRATELVKHHGRPSARITNKLIVSGPK
jgi:hypothetical protein